MTDTTKPAGGLSEEEIATNEGMFRRFGNAATMSAEQQQRALATIRALQEKNATLSVDKASLQQRNERLREALEFYADPRAKMEAEGERPEDVRLPDFWSEMDFSERAQTALEADHE